MGENKEFMYEIIYRDIHEKIKNGTYPIGTRIPSEKEVAEEYGVSRITSKKALTMLAEEGLITRKRGKGSYVQNVFEEEAGLKRPVYHNTKLVGFILDNFGSDFGDTLVRSVERSCNEKGYSMVLKCTYGNIDEERRSIRQLRELGACGLILICAQDEVYNMEILQLVVSGYPIVLVDRKMKGLSIPCISTNNHRAASDLTEFLIQRGHKHICYISHSMMETSSIRERYEGFADCILNHEDVNGKMKEISCYTPVSDQENFSDEEMQEMEAIIMDNQECTAFITVEYRLGELAGVVLDKLGLDKEVVSFDRNSAKTIACVRQNENEMGRKTVETLDRVIRGERITYNIDTPYQIEENKEMVYK
jgi:DNA-binding LacI/PurR family transcriptional regulator